jgi:hypothetical protein
MQGHFVKHCVFFFSHHVTKIHHQKKNIGLDVANLVIFIPKNGQKFFNKNHKIGGGGPLLVSFVFPPFFLFVLFWGVFGASSIQAPENHMRQSPQQH